MIQKVLSLEAAADKAETLRISNKKVVLCHGTFDLVHVGHVHYFEEARTFGDVLFVSVTADRFINKGPGRPVFPLARRMEMLAALMVVDFVLASDNALANSVIERLCPHYYVKGPDYARREDDPTGGIYSEELCVKKCGGQIAFTTGQKWSSTKLFQAYLGGE